MPQFDDATIEAIFGSEEAEGETEERFLQYFYYNDAFNSLDSDLPIRILVGHKGVGKSALLKRAYISDKNKDRFAYWFRPNDLLLMKEDAIKIDNFITRVEQWKISILKEIVISITDELYENDAMTVAPEIQGATVRDLQRIIWKCVNDPAAKHRIASGAFITVYIDDIDRGWSAKPADIQNISALLNAIRDIVGAERKFRFRIGLRSDVYFLVRTSDESTDKIERHVLWLTWKNDQILRMMAKRIETYFNPNVDKGIFDRLSQSAINNTILSKVIDPYFLGRGHWYKREMHHVLLSLTRARPRDLIKLLHGAARIARRDRNEIISTANLEESFEKYSQERLQDIFNEFRSEMPEIEKLLLHLRPTKVERRTKKSYVYTTDAMSRRLSSLLNQQNLRFSYNRPVNTKTILHFLYKMDFITARKRLENDVIDRKYFDESRFLANEVADFGYEWEVHPAYRWALQPQDIQDVIDSLAR